MRRIAWLTIGWGLAAVIVLGLYLRWSPATTILRIGLVGIVPVLLVGPVIGVVIAAWRADSAYLRLAALGTTVVYLATFVSFGSVIGCGRQSTEDEIVIYSHNVRWHSGDPTAIAAAIAAADPDVIVLQEVWPELRQVMADDPELTDYRFRATEIVNAPAGLAVWSRWPMSDAGLSYVAKRPILEATIEGPSGAFRVRGVHLASPITNANVLDWIEGLADLEDVDAEGASIMAGDFNSTNDHAQFRQVLDQGWTDAHEPKGCGFDATWPVGTRLPFSVLRLDHVLVSDDFEVLAVEIGEANGSDHQPVVATVRLTDSSPDQADQAE